MVISEIIITVLVSSAFMFVSKKLEKLDDKLDRVENDVIKLTENIERRAEIRCNPPQ
jgi:hypothetical protein